MKMIRKPQKKSHNHGIAYPMVEETEDSLIGFNYNDIYDSNGNYIRTIICNNNPKRDED